MSKTMNDFRGSTLVKDSFSDDLDRKLSKAAEQSANRAGEAVAKAIAQRLASAGKMPKTA